MNWIYRFYIVVLIVLLSGCDFNLAGKVAKDNHHEFECPSGAASVVVYRLDPGVTEPYYTVVEFRMFGKKIDDILKLKNYTDLVILWEDNDHVLIKIPHNYEVLRQVLVTNGTYFNCVTIDPIVEPLKE